jgi:phosphoribosyl 1,2-cyclic phosphodiesterase
VPHDAVETIGFVVRGEGIRAGYAADLGERTATVADHLRGCHVVALEFNHDVDLTREGPYPWGLKERILGRSGHLSNEEAATLLADVVGPEARHVVLTHLSRVNNDERLALAAARAGLEDSARPDVPVEAAPQDRPATPIRL